MHPYIIFKIYMYYKKKQQLSISLKINLFSSNSPRIINVRVIDRHYLILTINKRLFTMKVENHDTTKLGNQHENLLKREIQRMNKCIISCNHLLTCY
jgi:hypothetical protein